MTDHSTPSDEAHFNALRDILLERQRQDAKFGEQNLDPMLYLIVLTEEAGEVAKAILDIRFEGDETVLANWNLDRIDDELMEARRPAGLPTGDARTPDSAKSAQCLATWHAGNPARQREETEHPDGGRLG
jgi:hypothetical protein